jgi:hypothetical protein
MDGDVKKRRSLASFLLLGLGSQYNTGMVAAIRKEVIIENGGTVRFSSPELVPGTRAEVIVLIPSPAIGEPDIPDSSSRLRAFREFQSSAKLTAEEVATWQQRAAEERRAYSIKSESRWNDSTTSES